MASVEELIEIEAHCIETIRRRAREIRGANPTMTEDQARYQAGRELPLVLQRYNFARNVLVQHGIPALKVR
jgi:hypothetical protein